MLALGIGMSSVQRIWQAHGLKPHRAKGFRLSRDPAKAVVPLVDEKSQIQALDRSSRGRRKEGSRRYQFA